MDLGCSGLAGERGARGEPCEQSREGPVWGTHSLAHGRAAPRFTHSSPPHSSRDRCWNPCLLTASAQELGAQRAVAAHTRGTAGSLRVARGLGPRMARRSSACSPAPREGGTRRLATFLSPFRC